MRNKNDEAKMKNKSSENSKKMVFSFWFCGSFLQYINLHNLRQTRKALYIILSLMEIYFYCISLKSKKKNKKKSDKTRRALNSAQLAAIYRDYFTSFYYVRSFETFICQFENFHYNQPASSTVFYLSLVSSFV